MVVGLSVWVGRIIGMFDSDVGELDSGAALAAAADLRAHTYRAESRLLQVAAHWADLNAPDDDPHGDSGAGEERHLVYGGDGCPRVGEFACAELGAALGTSSRGAAGLISDALGLRHRMPRLWAGVLAGRVAPWRARRIVHACVTLSREAARIVDAQVAGIANRVGEWRLRRIIEAAILAVDPEQAQANADAMARERGVWVGQSDSYGTKRMSIKAAAGDVARLDARIDQVADILAELGDMDDKDLRRAKAIGWLADPESTLELLIHTSTNATPPRRRPRARPEPEMDPSRRGCRPCPQPWRRHGHGPSAGPRAGPRTRSGAGPQARSGAEPSLVPDLVPDLGPTRSRVTGPRAIPEWPAV